MKLSGMAELLSGAAKISAGTCHQILDCLQIQPFNWFARTDENKYFSLSWGWCVVAVSQEQGQTVEILEVKEMEVSRSQGVQSVQQIKASEKLV